jgi:hypothetical protein
MQSISAILDALGGNAAVARGIDAKPSAISEMRRRRSIPVQYWPSLVRFAASQGIELTNDDLVAAHTERAA